MPIAAAANKLKKEMETGKIKEEEGQLKTQYSIMKIMGIPDEEIPAFQDAQHWLKYFPPIAQNDLNDFGIFSDQRRAFITTSTNPYYNKFIEWQFRKLQAKGYVKFGHKPTIFSQTDNQPCADHDRAKGEGVGPQEYTLIKIKLLDLPESLKSTECNGKNVFLPAATLRPETMYGQTNCFIKPESTYGVFKMKGDEYFVCSERSALNMAYQNMTEAFGKVVKVAEVNGSEMIGMPLKAPLAKYEIVYCLPMDTISMFKGTGVVTSVPSDSPDDWACLRDLQQKPGLREKYKVKEEWVKDFEPVSIINLPTFGNMSAIKIVDDMKIQSYKDKDKLKEAKQAVYKEGFYEGVMLVGVGKDMKVQDAKPITRKFMVDNGEATGYYEPEDVVVSRSGDECVVALCDQWFISYSDEDWSKFVMDHVKSENFESYNQMTLNGMTYTIDWLKDWACSRT